MKTLEFILNKDAFTGLSKENMKNRISECLYMHYNSNVKRSVIEQMVSYASKIKPGVMYNIHVDVEICEKKDNDMVCSSCKSPSHMLYRSKINPNIYVCKVCHDLEAEPKPGKKSRRGRKPGKKKK